MKRVLSAARRRVWNGHAAACGLCLLGLGLPLPAAAAAGEPVTGTSAPAVGPEAPMAAAPVEPPPAAPAGLHYQLGAEAKLNFRVSHDARFPVPFPFTPDQLPVGQTHAYEETVDPGSHLEVSNLTLLADAGWSDLVAAHAKLDFLNLYYRNPTSTDRRYEITELWLRLGREPRPASAVTVGGAFLKLGKLAKFERQNDRHLESYGLVSTAFNRFEDVGAEVGADGSHLYARLSGTVGNPVFLRDPNALAGDNGTPALRQPHPHPALDTGIDILYDSHVNSISWSHPQLGAGLGLRWAAADGSRGVDVLAWGRRRTLAPAVSFYGTFYRGDLRVLEGPPGFLILPVRNDVKSEAGANLWLYLDAFTLFGQFVDQRLAGLPRRGYEAEAAWRFELPLWLALRGHQLLTAIAPAVRFSRLTNGFHDLLPTPAPSFAWPWNKLDAGIRVGLYAGIDLTAEYADNTFTLAGGAKRHENELLSTLRLRI
jgi:hypothetical protein